MVLQRFIHFQNGGTVNGTQGKLKVNKRRNNKARGRGGARKNLEVSLRMKHLRVPTNTTKEHLLRISNKKITNKHLYTNIMQGDEKCKKPSTCSH